MAAVKLGVGARAQDDTTAAWSGARLVLNVAATHYGGSASTVSMCITRDVLLHGASVKGKLANALLGAFMCCPLEELMRATAGTSSRSRFFDT